MPWIIRLILSLLIMLLTEYYLIRRVSTSIKLLYPNSPILKYKFLKISLFFIINLVPVFFLVTWILQVIGGPAIDLPEKNSLIDFLFYYPFWIAITIFLQSTVLILPIDLIYHISRIFKKINTKKLKIFVAKFILLVTVISFFYVPIRIIFDMTQVSVRTTVYKNLNLNEDLDQLKICVISDIQADWYNSEKRIDKYIDKLNETNPDLVLIPGDMITHDKESIPIAAKALGRIKSKYGVYACVGDHDNWAYGRDIIKSRTEIIKQLADFDVKMIDNENYILHLEDIQIGMTFITDTYSERIQYEILDSLTHKLSNVDFRILITHQPNGITRNVAVKKDYNLMITGHTHGGQITLFFPFINLSPTLFETKYVKGDFWFDNLLMIVNGGLGMSLAPIRYNSTPEVTSIILKQN